MSCANHPSGFFTHLVVYLSGHGISQLGYQNIVADHVISLIEANVSLLSPPTCFVLEENQSGQVSLLFGKPTPALPDHLLLLHVPRNVFLVL